MHVVAEDDTMEDHEMIDCQRMNIDAARFATVVRFCKPRIAGLAEVEELGQQLYQIVEQQRPSRLLLDLSGVQFLSSAALGKLIALNARVKAQDGVMRLCNVQPDTLRIFHACQLDRIFEIHSGTTDATASWVS
jgi:anti-sigma B factor antagonist